MRFHCLGIPHTVTSKDYVACAYTQKVLKFCKMMKDRGHTIFHYGHEDSEVECTEHITVTTNEDLKVAYGNYNWKQNFFSDFYSTKDHAYTTYYINTIKEIHKRKKKYDFVLAFWGWGHKPVCDAFPDLTIVEPGIGYNSGIFAPFKIFESYALMHGVAPEEALSNCKTDWYSVVVPNYFDVEDFEYKKEKEDYFLFLGRVYEGKGVHIAIQAAEAAGVKLKIAGQGGVVKEMSHLGYTSLPTHVEEVGYADVETRKKLMANAKAGFVPSLYHEPFGGVQVEYLLSGTPTITTDWGAFVENNLHGLTGYRCRTFGDFVEAAKNIDKIDPKFCRQWAEKNFSMKRVAFMYEKVFTDIMNVVTNSKGWYNSYSDLSCLERYYPGVK